VIFIDSFPYGTTHLIYCVDTGQAKDGLTQSIYYPQIDVKSNDIDAQNLLRNNLKKSRVKLYTTIITLCDLTTV
jgi:hypothetical protein